MATPRAPPAGFEQLFEVLDAFEGDQGNQLARLVIFLSSAP